MLDIKGIEKSILLHQLWRFSQAQGMSFLNIPKEPVNKETFEKTIKERESKGENLYFDYLMGKVIKCDITGDEFSPYLYDRDNGKGKADLVVKFIRQESK